MKKIRTLSLILSVVMMLTVILPAGVFATEIEEPAVENTVVEPVNNEVAAEPTSQQEAAPAQPAEPQPAAPQEDVQEQPAAEPQQEAAQPVEEQPAAEPQQEAVAQPVEEQPAAEPQQEVVAQPVEEQPAAEPQQEEAAQPVEEQPAAEPQQEEAAQPVEEQPSEAPADGDQPEEIPAAEPEMPANEAIEETVVEATVAEEEQPFEHGYVRVNNGTVVYAGTSKQEEKGSFSGNAVVYATVTTHASNEAYTWLKIVFDTTDAKGQNADLQTGYVQFKDVVVLTDEAVEQLTASLRNDSTTRSYGDKLIPTVSFSPLAEETTSEIPEEATETETASESGYVSEASWDDAPTNVSVEQIEDTKVRISWEPAEATGSYLVFEVNGDGTQTRKVITASTSTTLTNVAEGTHIYVVQARKKTDGAWQYGSFSEGVSVTVVVKAAWQYAPTITSVEQIEDTKVRITWEPAEATGSYLVFEVNEDGTRTRKVITGSTSTTLTNVTEGDHTYAVQARKSVDGKWVYGDISEGTSVTVVVKPAWQYAPTNVTVEQTDNSQVTISWEPAEATGSYRVFEVFEDGSMTSKVITASTTTTLKNVSEGAHTYAVQARKVVDGKWTYGDISEGTSVTVVNKAAWQYAPTNVTAEQIANGKVTIAWEPAEDTGSYLVFEVNEDETRTRKVITASTSTTLTNVTEGTHKYVVQARKKIDGTWQYSDYSDEVTIEVSNNIIIDGVTYAPITTSTCAVVAYEGTASSLVIPETVEGMTVVEIGVEAFMDNKSLVSIDLPDTITVIRARAFKGCTSLSNMQ